MHIMLLKFFWSSKVCLVQSLSHVQLFATPWAAAGQASLSITNSCNLLKLMSIESVMPSNHLILCHPLLFLPSIFPSITVFSKESVLCIGWPKYWNFSFSISSSNEYSVMISFSLGLTNLTGNISSSSFTRGISNYFPKFPFYTPLDVSFPQLCLFTQTFCPLLGT